IVAWVDSGAKEGNAKALPPAPEFTKGGWQIGKPDVVLSMQKDWVVEVNAPDNYINFWIPTNFTEDKWVQSAEIIPGNRKVVHHVIAFIQPAKLAEARMNAEKTGQARSTGNNPAGSMMYWDGTLRRVKMDAPVVDNTCDNQTFSRRAGGGGGGG